MKKPLLYIGSVFHSELFEKTIRLWNYSIESARTTQQVVCWASQTDYSLIFMEMDLPAGELFLLAKKLRRTRNRQTPFIGILNGDLALSNEITCLRVGVTDYLRTPVDACKLKQILERWIV